MTVETSANSRMLMPVSNVMAGGMNESAKGPQQEGGAEQHGVRGDFRPSIFLTEDLFTIIMRKEHRRGPRAVPPPFRRDPPSPPVPLSTPTPSSARGYRSHITHESFSLKKSPIIRATKTGYRNRMVEATPADM